MGIRAKIISLFFIGFCILSAIGLYLMEIKDVTQSGNIATGKIVLVLLVVAFLNGFVLLMAIHTMLIRRLDKMIKEVNELRENGKWEGNLVTFNKSDEFYQLEYAINQLLSLIRQQMMGLEFIAKTDGLTQIPNRLAFDHQLAVDLSMAKRNQSVQLSLFLIDVDFFKQYNDYYGHPAGDLVLQQIAQLISVTASRPSDLCARIGGEEFAIILPTSTADGAIYVANKLLNNLAKLKLPHAKSSISEYVTFSIGVTIAVNSDTVTTLLKRADDATYLAKSTGRNKIYFLEAQIDSDSKSDAESKSEMTMLT